MEGSGGTQIAGSPQEGDKRWAAILALDIVGFANLTQSLGAETVYDLLQDVLQTARTAIEEQGGHVVDTAGDGLLAAFGAPTALENASLQSCRAADAVLSSLAARSDALLQRYKVVPQVRIGIAGGDVMVAHHGTTAVKLVGDPVNLAARLESLALSDAVLMTDVIKRDVSGFVETTTPETVQLKGFADPVLVYRMGSILETPTRFDGLRKRGLGAFVSRGAEVAQALGVVQDADAPNALLLSGVAGIGKSRLLFEVLDQIAQKRRGLIGQCAPDKTASPFAPIAAIIQTASGLQDTASQRQQLEALRDAIPGSCDDVGIARFTAPRALERDSIGRVLHDRDFLEKLLSEVARATDAVLVIEDLHWMDAATGELLDRLISNGIAVITTSRNPSDLRASDNLVHIALTPMNDPDIGNILNAQTGHALAPTLAARVIKNAEGIPLIAEEIGHAIQASEHLQETDAGLDLPDGTDAVLSGNLQQLVLSRVDRLPASQRKTLQIASAIGRDFSWGLLERVTDSADGIPGPDQFDGIVDALDPKTGRFSHALIREAVYDGLLTSQRKDIHRRIAAALAAQAGPVNTANLADHYVAAEMRQEAAQTLILAAEESLQVYDLAQVDARLTQAFDLVQADPAIVDDRTYARLCHHWMRALAVSADYRRILKVSEQFFQRLQDSPYTPESTVARAIVGLARTGARDYAGARDLLQQTIADAEHHQDPHGAAWAKVNLARVYDETTWEGPDVVQQLCDDVLPVAETIDDRLLTMTALYIKIASYRACGRRQEALATADRIEAIADKYEDRRARGYANWARAIVHSIGGDPEAAAKIAQIAKQDILPQSSDSRVLEGIETFTQVYSRHPDEVRPVIEKSRALALDLLDYNLVHSADWIRTVLELRAGNLAVGWRMANDILPTFNKAGNMNIVRQAHIMRGEVLLAIAGLIDPDAEAPPERPKPVRGKPKLADILTFIKLKLTARRQARIDLETCIRLDPQQRGAHFARAHIGLGLIAASKGQPDKARTHLELGLDHAAREGIAVLCARAEAGLAKL